MCGDAETREHISCGGPHVERQDGAPRGVAQPAAVKRSPPNSCLIKPMDCVPERQRAVGEQDTLLLKGQHTNLLALSSSAGAAA